MTELSPPAPARLTSASSAAGVFFSVALPRVAVSLEGRRGSLRFLGWASCWVGLICLGSACSQDSPGAEAKSGGGGALGAGAGGAPLDGGPPAEAEPVPQGGDGASGGGAGLPPSSASGAAGEPASENGGTSQAGSEGSLEAGARPKGGTAADLTDAGASEGSGGVALSPDAADDRDAGSEGPPGTGRDTFGITQLYPSAIAPSEWSSSHWTTAAPYDISERRDPFDPSGLSGMRGTGSLSVEASGELVMSGSQPRIYIYSGQAPWTNVEVTVYYQRVADQDTAWAGLVIGVRSGEDGHTDDGKCDAHTYYSRVRNDGTVDFEKELEHTPSSTRGAVPADEVWPPDGEVPRRQWIGWKYVVYTQAEGQSVHLEAYRDLSAGAGGGDWQLVGETDDAGGWFTQTTCAEYSPVDGESDQVILTGGTVFVRNTDVEEARYKWLSVREIEPRVK